MKILLFVVGGFLLWVHHVVVSLALVFVPRRFRKRKDVTGQTILITGAGSGLGRQLAIEFSKLKVRLVLLDIDRLLLKETEKLLDSRSKSVLHQCDVTKPDQVYEVASKVKKEVGAVDVLVNNAGVVCGKSLLEIPDEMIVRTMEVNVMSHFWMCKAFLPAMMAKNSGHVVSITSIIGKVGCSRLTDYAASKHAAVGFAEALEMELREQRKDGVKVTIVCPTLMNTGLFQGAKLNIMAALTPEYVAKEVVLGILEEKEYINLPSWIKLLYIIKEIIPRWLQIWFIEKTGDIQCMVNFKGRLDKANVPNPKCDKLKQ